MDHLRRSVRVCACLAVAALLVVPVASARRAAAHWSPCGKLTMGGRSYQVAVSGKITCSSARHWVPILQGRLVKHFGSLFDGPPGWKCVAGFTSSSRTVKGGVLAECAKVKSYADLAKAKMFFVWLPANEPLPTK